MDNKREQQATEPQVSLRAMEPEDVDRLYIWENDRTLWPYGATRAPLSRHQLWEYANNYDANPFASGQLRLIIESCGPCGEKTPCGTIDLYDIDPMNSRAFIGIMVADSSRGKGIATAAMNLAAEYCRDILGLALLAAEVPADNQPSVCLFGRSLGYTQTGRRPGWYRRADGFVSAILFQKKLRRFQ